MYCRLQWTFELCVYDMSLSNTLVAECGLGGCQRLCVGRAAPGAEPDLDTRSARDAQSYGAAQRAAAEAGTVAAEAGVVPQHRVLRRPRAAEPQPGRAVRGQQDARRQADYQAR